MAIRTATDESESDEYVPVADVACVLLIEKGHIHPESIDEKVNTFSSKLS